MPKVTMLPGDPRKGAVRKEADVQTILPVKKPQQVRDFEERSK